ncbi:MAG: adenylate/guanylate cyclase domain-containing protein [Nitrosopumilaceae archaeon]
MGIMPENIRNFKDIIPKYENQMPMFRSWTDVDEITFSENCCNCCVGVVDMVNSTRISTMLSNSKLAKYYSTFLNTMSLIARRFGAVVVKNVGDSLLYYFPETSDIKSKYALMQCLECSLAMIDAHDSINSSLEAEGMPPLDYRVSIDYGTIMMARSSSSPCVDIFGPTVNMCSKMNCKAVPNSIIMGGDMYQIVKGTEYYRLEEIKQYSIGFKFPYPTYGVARNNFQNKTLVSLAIERALFEIGSPTLKEVSTKLLNKYKCRIGECYEKPEYLSRVLKELSGNSHSDIVTSIRKQLEEFTFLKPVQGFLEGLSR